MSFCFLVCFSKSKGEEQQQQEQQQEEQETFSSQASL